MIKERDNFPAEDFAICETCGAARRRESGDTGDGIRCDRCGSVVRRYRPNGPAQTAALALAALILYVPANIYPMMTMRALGRETENTVWDGVVVLYRDGMWFVATIVFLASIVIPLLKLIGLFFLACGGRRWPVEATRVHKIVRWLGPWAMLDVFLMAVAVALVKFGAFGSITPGPGLTAFTAVVVLTLLASMCFDPRSIWREEGE
jgi:paraquat-inducible protein A